MNELSNLADAIADVSIEYLENFQWESLDNVEKGNIIIDTYKRLRDGKVGYIIEEIVDWLEMEKDDEEKVAIYRGFLRSIAHILEKQER